MSGIQNIYRAVFSLFFLGTFFVSGISNATTATGQAAVTIVSAVNLSETQSMDFGVLVVDTSSARTAQINPDGSMSVSSGVQAQGAANKAIFTASGAPNAAVSISFQNAALNGSGNAMTLHNFTHNAGGSPMIGADGALEFSVGASLEIDAGQSEGNYSGSYQVTVNYQ